MFILVSMVVFWTVNGFFGNEEDSKSMGNSWYSTLGYIIFSGIVGYLSVNFILTSEIYSVMSAYSALGLTFTLIIPFIIVLVFTAKLVTSKYITMQKILVQRVIWGAYLIFVGYYLLTSERSNEMLNWIILAMLAISLFIFLFNNKFIKEMRKMRAKAKEANAHAKMQEARLVAAESENREALDKLRMDQRRMDEIQKKMDKDVRDLYEDATGGDKIY